MCHKTSLLIRFSPLAVLAAVAALVSAFNDGSDLTEKCRQKWNLIKDKKQQKKKQEQEEQSMVRLHDCLSSGQTRVSDCYNDHYKAMGQIFAEGDGMYQSTVRTEGRQN